MHSIYTFFLRTHELCTANNYTKLGHNPLQKRLNAYECLKWYTTLQANNTTDNKLNKICAAKSNKVQKIKHENNVFYNVGLCVKQ